MRGLTTQNLASSTMRPAALFAIFALTSTASAPESCTAVTRPIFTSLYFTKVLPASIPWEALNTIVIVGPSLRMRCSAMPPAASAATIGTIQTSEMRAYHGRLVAASGGLVAASG